MGTFRGQTHGVARSRLHLLRRRRRNIPILARLFLASSVEQSVRFGYDSRFMNIRLSTFAVWLCALSIHAQLINGVSDRVVYTDQASFSVPTNAGFTYQVTLNGMPVAAGV